MIIIMIESNTCLIFGGISVLMSELKLSMYLKQKSEILLCNFKILFQKYTFGNNRKFQI